VENDAQSSAGRLKRLDGLAYLLDNSIPIPARARGWGSTR
jgi:hypothetical protein